MKHVYLYLLSHIHNLIMQLNCPQAGFCKSYLAPSIYGIGIMEINLWLMVMALVK